MKKFITNLIGIATTLGFKAKLDAGKLSAEEQQSIVAEYDKLHGEGAWNADLKAYQDDQAASRQAEALSKTFKEIAEAAGVPEAKAETPEGQAAVVAAIKDLKGEVSKLASQAQEDKPSTTVTAPVAVTGAHTADFAFGIHNDFYATTKRYNRILVTGRIDGNPSAADRDTLKADFMAYANSVSERFTELHKLGLIPAIRKGDVSLDSLTSDTEIGTRQFNVRRDMLIARIIALPTLAGIFDTVSNVQT